MFLSACVLAVLPGAGVGPSVVSVAPADGGKLLFVTMKIEAGRTGASSWVCVWDLAKPELKAVVRGLPGDVRLVQPSADGKRFVLIGGDNWSVSRVESYDAATGKKLHALDLKRPGYAAAAASPDGNWVAYRSNAAKAAGLWVWNAQTGERAGEVEKTVGETGGALAFSNDSKQLVVASQEEYAEFDLATGKKTGGWKRKEPVKSVFLESRGWLAVLPDGKGTVTVAPTGKRRQSYVVRIVTEKNDWLAAEFWDFATAPVLSPDGRTLIVPGGARGEDRDTFVLKLGADGAPEMEERKEKPAGPWVPGLDKKVPAWRAWSFAEPMPASRAVRQVDLPGHMAFTPDGKRLFVAGAQGRVHVHDAERRVPTATLFAAEPGKDGLPAWNIVTSAGEFVGSPAEAEALTKSGKTKDAAKVKEALGVK